MLRSTRSHRQSGFDAERQELLVHAELILERVIDFPPVERPHNMACFGNREGDAFHTSSLAGCAELAARGGYRRRALQVDGGLLGDVGEAGHRSFAQIPPDGLLRHDYRQICGRADHLLEGRKKSINLA
jgi:hypothetical protein